jgi:CrcB protein
VELRTVLAVGFGAALGGMARLVITQLVVARAGVSNAFYATLFINVTGSFLIGVVAGLAQSIPGFPPVLRLFLATGIIGGYTTFSAFALEALSLGSAGSLATAIGYAIGSVVLGVVAAFGGLATGRVLAR